MNPARSLATAVYGGGDALAQLWVFLLFPLVGAVIAGLAFRIFDGTRSPAPFDLGTGEALRDDSALR